MDGECATVDLKKGPMTEVFRCEVRFLFSKGSDGVWTVVGCLMCRGGVISRVGCALESQIVDFK